LQTWIADVAAGFLMSTMVAVGPVEDDLSAYLGSNHPMALRDLQPLARRGNPGAQWRLGLRLYNGEWPTQGYPDAARWYTRAAQQGDPYAQLLLGELYGQGQPGVPQDRVLAYMWLDLAVQAYAEREAVEMAAHIMEIRDRIGSEMTAEALTEARQRAAGWTPRKE
jgi:TPR repeat protein